MKRSEMYKLMVETFLNEVKDYDCISTLDVAVHMDQVLNVIEEAGMIPPITYFKELDIYDNGWEAEDEKEEKGS